MAGNNLAKIGFQAETQDLVKAEKALDNLVPAAERAERASEKLARSMGGTANAAGRLRDENGRFIPASQRAAAGLERMDREATKTNRSITSLAGGMRLLVAGVGALAGAAVVSSIVQMSDDYTSMVNVLKVVEGAQGDVNGTLNELQAIASRTRAPLQATVSLYQRMAIASREMGVSQGQVFRFTENIGLALAQQGGSAEQAAGALFQLSQAMGGGVVRAEEFNSIIEGAYPIMLAAAKGVEGANGSIAKLRQMMLDGKLTSKIFFDAILSQTDDLTEAFENTTPTIGAAFQQLRDNLTMFLGRMNDVTGASGGAAQAILFVANNIRLIASFAAAAAIGIAAAYTPAIIGATRATMAWTAALIAQRGALAATGWGVIVIALGLLINELLKGMQALGSFGEAAKYVKNVAVEVFDRIYQLLLGLNTYIDGAAVYLQVAFAKAFAFVLSNAVGSFTKLANFLNSGFGKIGIELAIPSGEDFLKGINDGVTVLENNAKALTSTGAALIQDAMRPLETQMTLTGDAAGGASDDLQKLLDQMDNTDKGAKKAKQALTELQKIAEGFDKLSAPYDQAGAAFDAAKTALDNGIITNEKYAASLKLIEDAFLRAGGTSDQWAKIVNGNTKSIAQQLDERGVAAVEGFGDSLADVATGGSANFGELANSLIRDMLRIALQAVIVKPMLDAFGFGSGTGGVLSGFGALLSAKGNAFDGRGVTAFASGGAFTNSVVSRATPFSYGGGSLGVMGEAGPEAVMPLQRGPDGSLGVQMYGRGAAPSSGGTQRLDIHVIGQPGELFDAHVEAIAEDRAISVTTEGLRQYDSNLPGRMDEISSDQRVR